VTQRKVIAIPEVRVIAGLSQAELGGHLDGLIPRKNGGGWTQPTVSEWERSKNPTLATLRAYIEACGGTLELRIRIAGDEYVLEDPAKTKHYPLRDGWEVQFRVRDPGRSKDKRKGPRIGKKRER
jgi:transcriptional regulator with XRE-family HTH domain